MQNKGYFLVELGLIIIVVVLVINNFLVPLDKTLSTVLMAGGIVLEIAGGIRLFRK